MQTEARIGMMVDGGGQRGFGAVHSCAASAAKTAAGELAVNSAAARKYSAQCHSQFQRQQQQQQQQPQVGALSHLFAGGVAGVVSKTCTAPLGRLTILFQTLAEFFCPSHRCKTKLATLPKFSSRCCCSPHLFA